MAYTLGFPSLLVLTSMMALSITTMSSLKPLASWFYAFAIFIPCYYLIYESWIYPYYVSPLRFLPTVPGFPLWGQTLTIITEEVGVPQRRWHQQHGPIIRYFLLFGKHRVSVIDDEALKQITVKNSYTWQKSPTYQRLFSLLLGDGIIIAEGDVHVQQRRALAPGFSTSSIKTLSPVFWCKALQLSKLWRAELEKKDVATSSIEVLGWLERTTLDIIGQAGFGTDFDSLSHPDTPLRVAYTRSFMCDTAWDRMFLGLQYLTSLAIYLPMRSKREIIGARHTLVGIASDIIRNKQSKKSQTLSREKDIISLIVRDNSTASDKMTFETMRDQVMTFLGAGHDTTSVAAAWILHLLSKNPAMQRQLRAEIREHMPFLFVPHSREDEAQIAKIDEDRLPYLNNVCRESLRYIPPVPVTARMNSADDQLCGYHIPAGTMVQMFSNTINRLPQFWGETADVFDPDRWDRLPDSYTMNAYMTFLHGPRSCIGKKFAETEIKALLCCLLSMYRFERDENVEDPEDGKMWRITLRPPKDGMNLKVSLLD